MKYNILRKLIRRLIVFMFLLIICPISVFSYSRSIEPKLLDMNQIEIKSKSVSKSIAGFKIVQFSDTHLGDNFSLDQLQHLVDKINDQKPDLIVFTGDLIDNSNRYDETNQIHPILKQLHAKYGKYAIYGNHDVGGAGKRVYSNVLASSGFKVLENSNVTIPFKDHHTLSIVGLDDYLLGRPDPQKAFANVQKNSFTLLLAHEPDIAKRLNDFPIDLQLSGHSHGGQVKLPFHKAIYTPPLAIDYTEGLYEIHNSLKPMSLYVNRGIGTTRLPIRFFSLPEISVFTLKS
ncbi:metallophosphoesterase [Bacillus sp. EAC]|uniref:metallophosphoesterase n=1 Tax=Bacillus sp. EAC TaxID=1978338 RepID=UPI000B439717|nr:metallophosphoesterase [Bacillus sp. EAC]